MAHITLFVTEAVIQQVNRAGVNQRQIAIEDDASADCVQLLMQLQKTIACLLL
jgi:hypothetical protein